MPATSASPIAISAAESALPQRIRHLKTTHLDRHPDTDRPWQLVLLQASPSKHIALKKIKDFETVITTARYSLSCGCHFDHPVYSPNPQDPTRHYTKEAQYHYNLHHLKNAVLWYNSSSDYLLQIIWFGFELHPPLHSPDDYQQTLNACRWGNIHNRLKNIPESRPLRDRYHSLQMDSAIRQIRELANSLKHRCLFELEESPSPRDPTFQIDTNDPTDYIWNSPLLASPVVKYLDLVQALITTHDLLIDFEDYLIDLLGFDQLPKVIEYGKTHLVSPF